MLEQADYLYSCAETEKLYQLLLQYKDRYKREREDMNLGKSDGFVVCV